ncbi:MAG: glycine/sarcosine/betaine reductase complex component C subunit beta [Bacillota bacterium]|nr:glycine/sarcosine/betaine reductase complex component C subunit beta [Bacillota bacterium]
MNYSVVKASSYVLVHAPDMVIHNGTTQTMEKKKNPDSEYLKKLPKHLRTFEEVVNYQPNQTYIGNMTPKELKEKSFPWHQNKESGASRFGKFGEIMPQDEFIALIKISDVFDLVQLEEEFTSNIKGKLKEHPLFSEKEIALLKDGISKEKIERLVEDHAEALYYEGKVVGCVKRAHDVDDNLTSHIMFENLVSKASGILSLKNLVEKNNLNVEDIDYVIECSEEACGDMNQRGGGNFAKSIAESCGAINATGSDLRGFCAAPVHALINGASLVQAKTYNNVVVVAGGSTAKLGMNGKDHVKKDMPVIEDVIGGFAVLISKNDGINPIIRTDLVGKHNVGTGSSPQAVIKALIADPLDKGNLTVNDVDKYSVEMQNPDITKPAGAGDVPESNYKMIGAIGVMRKELERKELMDFVAKHGMVGWAPTQGHIPSGVPYLGFAQNDLTEGDLNRAMIVGKGSLFLGRMTNLFDGVSVIIERNKGIEEESSMNKDEINKIIAEVMKKIGDQLLNQ